MHTAGSDIGAPSELFEACFVAMTNDWASHHARNGQAWLRLLPDGDRRRALTSLLVRELKQMSLRTGEELSDAELGVPTLGADDVEWADSLMQEATRHGIVVPQRYASAAEAVADACPGEAGRRAEAARRERPPSVEQQLLLTRVSAAVDAGDGGVFFLSAGAGTGKTHTLNLLINELRAKGYQVRAMASSGIASQLLAQPARTVHSTCSVPRGVEALETPRLNIDGAAHGGQRSSLWAADVFVGDEACAANPHMPRMPRRH
eukprot:SAG11_NODE_324_length_10739_cov_86.975752_7_plen_262_part_00